MANPLGLGISAVVVAGALTVGGFKFFEKIDNGNVGIAYSMNGGVKDDSLAQGVHFVGLDKVTQYPVRTQTVSQKISLATQDGKKTTVKITYSYHVDSTKAVALYKKFGNQKIEDIQSGWMQQKLQKAGRAVVSSYSILDVVGEDSATVQGKILTKFQKDVESQGFIIEDLSFGVPNLDAQTQQTIDDITKASQDNKKAELEAKTKQTQAEAEANAEIAKAEGKAKAKIAEAEAEAKANDAINNSITDKTIAYMEAEARQAHGWVTTNGGQVVTTQQGN